MANWKYERKEREFEQVPEGIHRIRIRSVEKQKSKAGNEMLVYEFDVSGMSNKLFYYLVFLDDRPEITNSLLTQFYDSFKDIEEGNFNLQSWIGKVGAAKVIHDEEDRARIHYFINVNKQSDLPKWQEPDNEFGSGFTPIDSNDEDFPF